ncbi:MAG: hypothetical protein WBE46_06220 [Dehalococcoidia bacterium]
MTRLNGLKRQIRMSRWLIVALALVLVFGSVGISYARMQGGPQNKGVVPCCCDPFTWVVSNDDGIEDSISPYGIIDPGDDGGGTSYDRWGAQSSDDPSEPQTTGTECDRYDKDVARTTAWISEDQQEITVLVENAYPSYYPTVFFALECPDSGLGTITDIIIDNPYPSALDVSISGIYPGQLIPQDGEVTGAVHVHVEQPAAQNAVYTFRVSIATECQVITCGTAYAYHADYATCFLDLGFTKWGWTNGPLEPGSYEFQFWAGAAHCDTSNGRLVGQVTVDYDGSTAVVTYQMYEGNWMTATHLYVGSNRLPSDKKGNETVSPGQYPYKHDPLNNVTTDSYTVTGLSGDIYVVAHAVVCWFE